LGKQSDAINETLHIPTINGNHSKSTCAEFVAGLQARGATVQFGQSRPPMTTELPTTCGAAVRSGGLLECAAWHEEKAKTYTYILSHYPSICKEREMIEEIAMHERFASELRKRSNS